VSAGVIRGGCHERLCACMHPKMGRGTDASTWQAGGGGGEPIVCSKSSSVGAQRGGGARGGARGVAAHG